MNYRIDNLQYCKWSREVFQINREAGLDAVHVTLVYHEDYDEFLKRTKEWNKYFSENSDLIFPPLPHQPNKQSVVSHLQSTLRRNRALLLLSQRKRIYHRAFLISLTLI